MKSTQEESVELSLKAGRIEAVACLSALLFTMAGALLPVWAQPIPMTIDRQYPADQMDYNFWIPKDFIVIGDTIIIADQMVSKLFMLGPDGGLIKSVGRKGEGPGEFSGFITEIEFDQQDRAVWVMDRTRVQKFAFPSLEYLEGYRKYYAMSDMAFVDGTFYMFPLSGRENEIVQLYSRTGQLQGTLGQHPERTVGPGGMRIHLVGEADVERTATGVTIAFQYKHFNEIYLYRDNKWEIVKIQHPEIEKLDKLNRQLAAKWNERDYPYHIWREIDICEGMLFILIGDDRQGYQLLGTDFAGRVMESYSLPEFFQTIGRFEVSREDSGIVMWALVLEPLPGIVRMVPTLPP